MKVGIRRDTVPHLEQFALFAARMGAAGLSFAHVMPTSIDVADASALTLEERAAAEREIALLARIFKMRIGIDVGYFNVARESPCSALNGVSANVNYRGQLSLCCNLSGFRGATGDAGRRRRSESRTVRRGARASARDGHDAVRAPDTSADAARCRGADGRSDHRIALSLLPQHARQDAMEPSTLMKAIG